MHATWHGVFLLCTSLGCSFQQPAHISTAIDRFTECIIHAPLPALLHLLICSFTPRSEIPSQGLAQSWAHGEHLGGRVSQSQLSSCSHTQGKQPGRHSIRGPMHRGTGTYEGDHATHRRHGFQGELRPLRLLERPEGKFQPPGLRTSWPCPWH